MKDDKRPQMLREIELLDEDLEPIAGGEGIATDPGRGDLTPSSRSLPDGSPRLAPIPDFNKPVLKDPTLKQNTGVNRGFPIRNPDVEDISVTGSIGIKW